MALITAGGEVRSLEGEPAPRMLGQVDVGRAKCRLIVALDAAVLRRPFPGSTEPAGMRVHVACLALGVDRSK